MSQDVAPCRVESRAECADDEGMNTPGYRIVRWFQHWRLIDGAFYRDALAIRESDGTLREVSVLDEAGASL
jgi:hypothetical protein